MDSTLQTQLISYGLVLLVTLLFAGIKTQWLLFKIMSVQSSRTKKCLIRRKLASGNQYFVGHIKEGGTVVTYKDGSKKEDEHTINPHNEDWHTEFGVKLLETNSKNALLRYDGSMVRGFDAKRQSDYLRREAEKPRENSNTEKLQIFLSIFCIIIGIASVYMGYKNAQRLDLLGSNMNMLYQLFQNTTAVI